MASAWHPFYERRVRVEHWTNAVEQGAAVAHNIVHPEDLQPYSPLEYVWSDQYDWKAQIVGRPNHGTRHEIVGNLSGETPRAAVLYTDVTKSTSDKAKKQQAASSKQQAGKK